MTSKFTSIAKIKKQQRDKVESSLSKARAVKERLEKQLEGVMESIEAKEAPKEGTIASMNLFRENLSILRREKVAIQSTLIEQNQKIEHLKRSYKSAHIEFEKMKYLEQQDFEVWMEKLKKQEQLDMDEIANLLFKNEKR